MARLVALAKLSLAHFLQGAGIVWPTRIGKLELNVCQVLAKQPFDRSRVGLNFGFVPPSW